MNDDEPGRHREGPAANTQVFQRPNLHDMPTDPSMRIPLNQAHPRTPYSNRPDMVIPRVYVEPDEQMDDLRRSSLKWAVIRDRLAVLLILLLVGAITRPVWVFLIEAIR